MAAVLCELDLGHGPPILKPSQRSFSRSEAGREAPCPIARAIVQQSLVEEIGESLERIRIGTTHDRVVVSAKTNAELAQLAVEVRVPIEHVDSLQFTVDSSEFVLL